MLTFFLHYLLKLLHCHNNNTHFLKQGLKFWAFINRPSRQRTTQKTIQSRLYQTKHLFQKYYFSIVQLVREATINTKIK